MRKSDLLSNAAAVVLKEPSKTDTSPISVKFFFEQTSSLPDDEKPKSPAMEAMVSIMGHILKLDFDEDLNPTTIPVAYYMTDRGILIEFGDEMRSDQSHERLKEAAAKFIKVLGEVDGGETIGVLPAKLSILAKEKIHVLSALSKYLSRNDGSLVTLDEVEMYFPEEIENDRDLMRAYIDGQAKQVEEIYEKDPDLAKRLFEALPSRPYMSLAHCLSAHLNAYDAHIHYSLDHIIRMIEREDGLKRTIVTREPFTPSGYH